MAVHHTGFSDSILKLLAEYPEGLSNKQIAAHLGIVRQGGKKMYTPEVRKLDNAIRRLTLANKLVIFKIPGVRSGTHNGYKLPVSDSHGNSPEAQATAAIALLTAWKPVAPVSHYAGAQMVHDCTNEE